MLVCDAAATPSSYSSLVQNYVQYELIAADVCDMQKLDCADQLETADNNFLASNKSEPNQTKQVLIRQPLSATKPNEQTCSHYT